MLRRWGVLQNNLALSIGLIMWIGHRKEILNLTFRAFRPSSERIDTSTRPSLSDFRSICLSVCLSVYLSFFSSVSLSLFFSVRLSVCIFNISLPENRKALPPISLFLCPILLLPRYFPSDHRTDFANRQTCNAFCNVSLLFIAGSTRTLGQVKGAV